MGYIYCIHNKVNDKKYIGQTSLKYSNTRWSAHKLEMKNGNDRYLYRSMRKYGIDNFEFKILLKNVELEKLNFYEILWIEKFKTMSPNGYNLHVGGSNVSGKNNPMYGKISKFKGLKRPDISEKIKLTWTSDRKERYSKLFSGKNNPMYGKSTNKGLTIWSDEKPNPFLGKKHTEEVKEFLSEKQNKSKKPIQMICLDTGNVLNEFESVSSASKFIKNNTDFKKADDSFIAKCAKGRHKKAYGFKWRFIEKGVETIP